MQKATIDLDAMSDIDIGVPEKAAIEKSMVDDKMASATVKPHEEEMAPVDEDEFSDCGSIKSEGPKQKLFFAIKQIPILQRAVQMVQESFVTPDIEPGQRRQTLLTMIDKHVHKCDNHELHKKKE